MVEHKTGNLYWSNHLAEYYLCVKDKKGNNKLIVYPYFYLENIGDNIELLRFDEHCNVGDGSLLNRCCTEYKGHLENQVIKNDEETIRVQLPSDFKKRFSLHENNNIYIILTKNKGNG